MAHSPRGFLGAFSYWFSTSSFDTEVLITCVPDLLLPVTFLVFAALLAGCSTAKAPTWTYAPSVDGDAASASQPPAHAGHDAAPPAAPAAAGGTLEINAFDLGFEPAQLSVPAPGRYEVALTNTGAIPHDITFADGEMATANAGETATVEVDIPAEGLTFICSIPGHEQAGMKGSVTVEGAAPSDAPAADDHGGPMAETDVAADPNAPAPVTLRSRRAEAPRRRRSTTSTS